MLCSVASHILIIYAEMMLHSQHKPQAQATRALAKDTEDTGSNSLRERSELDVGFPHASWDG